MRCNVNYYHHSVNKLFVGKPDDARRCMRRPARQPSRCLAATRNTPTSALPVLQLPNDADTIGRHFCPTVHHRLWTRRCISTGRHVRNRDVSTAPICCPGLRQARRKAFPARSGMRKPLSMWKKSGLSTVQDAFTITTNLNIYSS